MAHLMGSQRRHLPWLALCGIAVVLAVRYPLHLALTSPNPYLMDFNVYRAVAQRILAGQAEQLYAPTTDSAMMVFKYAPLWAALWAPLGWLSAYHGAVLWSSLSAAALVAALAGCLALCRRAGLSPHPLATAATLALLTRPLAEEMGNGQVNAIWTALTIGGIAAAARARPWIAGAWFAASILLKLPSALFLAYFALRRQWGLLGRTLACLAAGLFLGAGLLAPWHPWRLITDWANALRHSGTTYAFEIGNQSLLVWLSRFLTDDVYGLNLVSLPRAALPWINVSLLGAGLWLVSRPRQDPPAPDLRDRRWLYDSAMLMVLMVLFSPSGWVATYLALVWPIYLCLLSLGQKDRAARCLTAAVIAASLLLHRGAWRAMGLSSWRSEGYLFLVFMILPWMGLLTLASLWRQRRSLPRV